MNHTSRAEETRRRSPVQCRLTVRHGKLSIGQKLVPRCEVSIIDALYSIFQIEAVRRPLVNSPRQNPRRNGRTLMGELSLRTDAPRGRCAWDVVRCCTTCSFGARSAERASASMAFCRPRSRCSSRIRARSSSTFVPRLILSDRGMRHRLRTGHQ